MGIYTTVDRIDSFAVQYCMPVASTMYTCVCTLLCSRFVCRDDGDSAVLITLLTPNGGNDEVTEALWELLSMATDVEFSDLSRFG